MKTTLLTIDIETESITSDKEDALNEYRNRITIIGTYNHETKVYKTYRDLELFRTEIWNNAQYAFNGHNLKFDLRNLIKHIGPISLDRLEDDTHLMAFVMTDKIPDSWLSEYEAVRKELNAKLPQGINHREASLHSLKTVAPYFLGVDPFWEDPSDHDSDSYVLKDVEYTQRLYYELKKRLENLNQYKFYKEKLLPWTRMILRAELEGVTLDVEATRGLQAHCENEIERVEVLLNQVWFDHYKAWEKLKREELLEQYTTMFNQAVLKKPENESKLRERYAALYEKALPKLDTKLNLESPKQLAWLLKERLQLDITGLDGKESTDKEVLNRLALTNNEVKLLLEHRRNKKLATAFLPKYLANTVEGKLHTNFNVSGTRTGRLSSSGTLNIQQIPRDLKYLFVADPGTVFITRDLSAIEPVLLAYYSEDEALSDIVLKGQSIHSVNAINMFGLDCQESEVKTKYPAMRDAAKEIGLSILYAAGHNQVRMSCQKRNIIKTEKESREIVNNVRTSFKRVWEFKLALDEVLEQGEVIYNLLGRPIKIQDPEKVYMTGLNTMIQSSASDLTLEIGLNISKIKGCTPVLFIHDSILTKVDLSRIEYPIEKINEMIEYEFQKFDLTTDKYKLQLRSEGGVSTEWE